MISVVQFNNEIYFVERLILRILNSAKAVCSPCSLNVSIAEIEVDNVCYSKDTKLRKQRKFQGKETYRARDCPSFF